MRNFTLVSTKMISLIVCVVIVDMKGGVEVVILFNFFNHLLTVKGQRRGENECNICCFFSV